MRISLITGGDIWWGVFHDANRSCVYLAPVPWILFLIAWGPRYDHGHMRTSRLIARRDRITGVVETLLANRENDWRAAHPTNFENFQPGSPSLPERQK